MNNVDKPNIIWIMFDSLRNEFLNEFGGESPRAYLDDLLSQGVSFTNCHSAAPFTVVSMASKVTGCYPSLHNIDGWLKKDPTKTINPLCIRFAEVLQYNGYRTFFMSNERYGIYVNHIGFDEYFSQNGDYDILPYEEYQKWESPKFVMLTMSDVHDECCHNMGHFYKKDYIASYIDTCEKIKSIISKLKTGNDFIIITSDHGIRCLDDFVGDQYNSETTTGRYLTEKTTHNSFNLIWPGHLKPQKINDLCRSVDMYPTIMDILGFEYPPLDGVSLKPLLEGGRVDIKYTYSLTGWSATHPKSPGAWCVKDGTYKLVITETKYGLRRVKTHTLINYNEDIEETNDLSDKMPDKVTELLNEANRILFGKRNISDYYRRGSFDYKKYLQFRNKRKNNKVEKEVRSIIKECWQKHTRKEFLKRYRVFRFKAILYWNFRPLYYLVKKMGYFKSDIIY